MQPATSIFQSAADFIHYTRRSVFLTGKAGTGKTTFLKYIKEHTPKQTVVLAPTGVAAINAGGSTIHSFFQLPFSPYVPVSKGFEQPVRETQYETVDKHHLLGRLRFNKQRIELLQQLELLIIDEISMVRCDVLDAVDTVLRQFRYRQSEPFGGVQMLLIGDMFQLSPVVTDEEWHILSQFYSSPYFMDSKVMQQQQPAHIELDKIYRQSDPAFISLLNKVRNNEMEEDDFRLLHSRYDPLFQPPKEQGYIILTTHNYKADTINRDKLNQLDGQLHGFKAIIEGEFSEKSYPADELLQLKEGAQVMFIKNDSEKIRRYFNGKIGIMKKTENDKIFVQCGDEPEIEVRKEKWENIHYSLNKTTQHIEEDVMGSFTQFPLRLAWAITIHKSQGLTFDKAVIDAGAAFTPGQVYVALSRCTGMQGMVLKSRITNSGLMNDERIVNFARQKISQEYLTDELKRSKHYYQSSVLTVLFDFSSTIKSFARLHEVAEGHLSAFNTETLPWIQQLEQKAESMNDVALKFKPQLEQLLQEDALPEQNDALQKRIKAAAAYFTKQIQEILQVISTSPAVTDSREYATSYNEALQQAYIILSKQLHIIQSCSDGFSTAAYHQHKKSFVPAPFRVNAYAGAASPQKTNSPHPALLYQLRKLRDKLCEQQNLPIYIVAGSNTLYEMSRYLPQNSDELSKISGFGKAKIEKYGKQFTDIICAYCTEQNLLSLIHEKIPKQQRNEKQAEKTDTKLETFQLYRSGKTVNEIATARNLTIQTIEGHLAHYVERGEISVHDLVKKEKFVLIEPLAKIYDGGSLTPIKEKLSTDVSFGEIRLVLAWMEFEKNKTDA